MVKHHSDSEKGAHCCHYSFRLVARVVLYVPSYSQDSTYYGLCYTCRGALALMRNSSKWVHYERWMRRPIAPRVNTIRKEGNVLFNDALNTFYLRLYGVRHMVKDHSDSEKGNPLPPQRLLFSINSNGSFKNTIPQTG